MDQSRKILSDVVVNSKYARFLEGKNRREAWEEIVDRNIEMHKSRFPKLEKEIEEAFQYVKEKKVLPSMRASQFAGEAIEQSENRIYNCCFTHVDDPKVFSEVMFLLLGGTGVGYSVQRRHINSLPKMQGPKKDENGHIVRQKYRIHDQIEGWADAVDVLVQSFFYEKPVPEFDYGDIRPKGAKLETSGGTAPGPAPLQKCLEEVEKILKSKSYPVKLKPIEAHDILCHIADAVLAGGIQRAAMISLFDRDNETMEKCKVGNWWQENPQRARANNSAVMPRSEVNKEEFEELWQTTSGEGFGEPGFFFTKDKDAGTNPCAEILLNSKQFCNLSTLNAHTVESQEDLNKRAKIASFIGTLQASYTDLHYLRHDWIEQTEEESLIGVSMTGIASGRLRDLDLTEAAECVKKENERVAEKIGVKPAARTTCVKPEGTSSLVLGTSSGIHAWHDDYYIRRMRVGKDEPIYEFLKEQIPEIMEDDKEAPDKRAVLSFPIKAPDTASTRDEGAISLLERVKRFNQEWVRPGHRYGPDYNNVSCTVSAKEDEWEKVGEWLWNNRHEYTGISVLPFDGGSYDQAPFEACDKEEYEKRMKKFEEVDIKSLKEEEDNTDLSGEIACGGGSCEIEQI